MFRFFFVSLLVMTSALSVGCGAVQAATAGINSGLGLFNSAKSAASNTKTAFSDTKQAAEALMPDKDQNADPQQLEKLRQALRQDGDETSASWPDDVLSQNDNFWLHYGIERKFDQYAWQPKARESESSNRLDLNQYQFVDKPSGTQRELQQNLSISASSPADDLIDYAELQGLRDEVNGIENETLRARWSDLSDQQLWTQRHSVRSAVQYLSSRRK